MSPCLAGLLALALVPWTMAAAVAGELETLVDGLGDEVYATRESSTAELIQRARGESDPVWKLVLKHFRSDPEPEVRMRCEVILQRHGGRTTASSACSTASGPTSVGTANRTAASNS